MLIGHLCTKSLRVVDGKGDATNNKSRSHQPAGQTQLGVVDQLTAQTAMAIDHHPLPDNSRRH